MKRLFILFGLIIAAKGAFALQKGDKIKENFLKTDNLTEVGANKLFKELNDDGIIKISMAAEGGSICH